MRKRVLAVYPPINDGGTITTLNQLSLCRKWITPGFRAGTFFWDANDVGFASGAIDWFWAIAPWTDNTIPPKKLSEIVAVVFSETDTFDRWFRIDAPVFASHVSVDKRASYEVIGQARRMSSGGVGLVAYDAVLASGDHERRLFESIWFQNEADAVTFKMSEPVLTKASL